MEIQLSVSNPKRALALLEFLKASELIDKFKILTTSSPSNQSVETNNEPTFFDRFYGSMPNLDVPAFENYLTETRNEWERPRS